jgi:uncharacterized Zn-finger protein
MAHESTPQFHNDMGAPSIEIGAREFECIGSKPPFDHPHVFLDMGDADELVCPYCATLFRYDPKLGHDQSRPAEARFAE